MTLDDHVRESTRCYLEALLLETDGETSIAARIADVPEAELVEMLDNLGLSRGVVEVKSS